MQQKIHNEKKYIVRLAIGKISLSGLIQTKISTEEHYFTFLIFYTKAL